MQHLIETDRNPTQNDLNVFFNSLLSVIKGPRIFFFLRGGGGWGRGEIAFHLSALLASLLALFSCRVSSCYGKMAPAAPGLHSLSFSNLGEKALSSACLGEKDLYSDYCIPVSD